MAFRPQNQCANCGYTWYPRGKNVSLRCPRCGGGNVGVVPPVEIPFAVVAVIGAVIVIVAAVIALTSNSRPRPEQQSTKQLASTKVPEVRPEPPIERGREVKPNSVETPHVPPTSGATTPLRVIPPADAELAPAPRRAIRNRPPASAPTEWVLSERVQTRVVGARVMKPYLTNDAGDEFLAVESMLVVWVETQNLTASRVSLRRWLNPLTESATLWVAGERLAGAKIPSGTRVLDQLEGEHKLSPGGPSAIDILAFQPPKSDKALFLQLLGSHVGESGTYKHSVPLEMWKGR